MYLYSFDNMAEIKEVSESPALRVLSDLTPELVGQVQQFRASVSDMDGRIRTPEEEEQRSEEYCSDDDARKWILALKDGELIGMTVLFGRSVTYEGRTFALGGIGKVRVQEDWRKKGVARSMMTEAMKQLAFMQSDVAFLDTNVDSFLGDFYREYGFVPLNKPYTFTGKSGKRYEDHDGMIAPVNSNDVFQEILSGSEPLHIGRGKW